VDDAPHSGNRADGLALNTRPWLKQAAFWSCLPVVLWPLFVLGYPLLYQDTVAYIHGGFVDRLHGMWFEIRSPLYAYWLFASTAGFSLYSVAVLQGLLALYVVKKACDVLSLGLAWRLVVVVLACTLSTLPWYASFITPDIFSGFVSLLLFGLLEAPGISLAATVLLGVSVAMHNTNIVLYPAVLATAWLLYRKAGVPLGKWLCLGLAGLAAALLVMSCTFARSGRLALNEFGVGTFLVNRWINDRVMLPFLEQLCTLPNPLVACRHLEEFRHTQVDGFWTDSFYIHEHGGFKAAQDELRWLTQTFIRHHPGLVARNALENAGRQFAVFGVPLWAFAASDGSWQYGRIFSVFRFDEPYFAASRIHDAAWRDRLYALMDVELLALYAVALPALILSSLPGLVGGAQRRLFRLCLLYYLYNVVLCGAVSGPFERFTGRVGWALYLASLFVVIRAWDVWRLDSGRGRFGRPREIGASRSLLVK